MNHYIVHLYREMRLTFADIEADTPEAAAAFARDKATGDADDIETAMARIFPLWSIWPETRNTATPWPSTSSPSGPQGSFEAAGGVESRALLSAD